MKRKYCRKQSQYEEILDAVETAIIQAAEISGLRNWLIWLFLNNLKKGEEPNTSGIVESAGTSLMPAFDQIINSDHKEFFASELYKNRASDNAFGGVGNPSHHRRYEYFREIGREEGRSEGNAS